MKEQDRASAYHEAGHAVAALYAGDVVEAVVIGAGARVAGEYADGAVKLAVMHQYAPEEEDWLDDMDEGNRTFMIDHWLPYAIPTAMHSLAGPAAETRYTGQSNGTGAWEDLVYVDRIKTQFDTWVDVDVFDVAHKAAETLVAHAWPAIVAVAERLVVARELDRDTVAAIVAEAWPGGEPAGVPVYPWGPWPGVMRLEGGRFVSEAVMKGGSNA
jgi:hypothetical protein